MGDGYRGDPTPSYGEQEVFVSNNGQLLTKWVEAEPLAQIRETDMIRFIWRNILSKFGIPRALVLDNSTQFMGKKVKDLLEQLKIEFYNSMLSYT